MPARVVQTRRERDLLGADAGDALLVRVARRNQAGQVMDEREEAFARGACRAVSAVFAGLMIGFAMVDIPYKVPAIAISAAFAGIFLAAAVVKTPEETE